MITRPVPIGARAIRFCIWRLQPVGVASTEACDGQRSKLHAPDWLNAKSVTDLKVKLIEVIAVLLAVLFLKGVLANPEMVWPDLVTPLAVALFAGTIWLIGRAD